jgi:hypothetical protein
MDRKGQTNGDRVEFKKRRLRENYEGFKRQDERGIICCNLKVNDKEGARGIMIRLKRVGKNKRKRTEKDEGTNRIDEINKVR